MSRMRLRPPRKPNTRGARLNDSKPASPGEPGKTLAAPAPALLGKARQVLGGILSKKK